MQDLRTGVPIDVGQPVDVRNADVGLYNESDMAVIGGGVEDVNVIGIDPGVHFLVCATGFSDGKPRILSKKGTPLPHPPLFRVNGRLTLELNSDYDVRSSLLPNRKRQEQWVRQGRAGAYGEAIKVALEKESSYSLKQWDYRALLDNLDKKVCHHSALFCNNFCLLPFPSHVCL